MTSAQLRAARALLKISVRSLAEAAGVHRNTVSNFETGKFQSDETTLGKIEAYFSENGIIFMREGECVPGGEGVRLRERV